MTQAHNADHLLDITLRELNSDPGHLQSMANSFIDQWVRALGAGHRVQDDIADELEQLKKALASGKTLTIAESLHSLAKLARQAVETAEDGSQEKLRQLSTVLDDLAKSLGRK
ncbi:hypothetical protein [Larkinella soli]|uniref:hypothetical protein n=1 Tax=Larkinella soli TaxID=1770527 RepID=UPI000FFBE9D6|nr:hypothetical protein [Larkinella soli]